MKNLVLFAMVALTTIGYSQDAGVSNVKIKIDSYRSYEIVGYRDIDTTWTPIDSLVLIANKFTYKLFGLEEIIGPDTTTGYFHHNIEAVEKLVGFKKSKETYNFNFTDSTLTRVVNRKRYTDDIISYYLNYDPLDPENENVPYVITVINKDGYEKSYEVNFNTGAFEYDVKSKDATRSVFQELTRRTNVVEFKKY